MIAGPVLRPLPESLGLVAQELGDLVRLGDKLERMIARLIAEHRIEDLELIAEGQAADLLTQRLAGVAAFVAALGESAPAAAQADILLAMQKLTLAEQQRKLAGPLACSIEPAGDGELLLFGD